MQLGTRWTVGDTLPTGLPEVVELAVDAVEGDLAGLDADTSSWRWTLTWLEGSPVIELDDGTVITYNARDDSARIVEPVQTVPDPFDD